MWANKEVFSSIKETIGLSIVLEYFSRLGSGPGPKKTKSATNIATNLGFFTFKLIFGDGDRFDLISLKANTD